MSTRNRPPRPAVALALAVLALACSERPEAPGAGTTPAPDEAAPETAVAPPDAADVPRAPVRTAAPDPSVATAPRAPDASGAPDTSEVADLPPPPGMRPLEDLLRLPSPAREEPDADLLFGGEGEKTASTTDPETGSTTESRVEIRYQSRTDRLGVPSGRALKSTDAGVAVGVGDNTRVRGGVRVDEEVESGVRQDPVPTIGIEKRF